MAEENKNQDPEEQKKSSGSDDDFGLPDFDFEALDDDDDEVAPEEAPASKATRAADTPAESTSTDDVPSMDTDDLEGLDLDDLEGLDLEDMGDLGDLNLDDLDLEDIDLGDLDTDLEEFKETEASSTYTPEKPVAASAERDEDIFDTSKGAAATSASEPAESFEDDGSFFEEETFDGFDMDSSDGDSVDSMFDADSLSSENFDEDIFGNGDADFDVDMGDGEEEPVPFAKRPVESTHHLDDEEEVHVSESEIQSSRGKFARIVILGILLFSALGFGFLYWNGTFSGGHGESKVVKTENKKDRPVAANDEAKKEEATNEEAKPLPPQPTDTKKAEEKTPVKEVTKKPEPKKEEPKRETPKKETNTQPKQTTTQPKTTTKPAPVRNAPGEVTVLSGKLGQSHMIVASFVDSQSAQDHARKLAATGASPVIIPPFDNAPNHRVAIASFSTVNEALQNLESYRQQYGSGVWILKY